jgi:ABC-type enterobactin transport system permease subunit
MMDDEDLHRIFGQILHRIVRLERKIKQLEEKQMATQAEIDTITGEVQAVATNLTAAQTALQGEIDSLAAANPQVDLGGVKTAVASLGSAVTALGSLKPLAAAPAAATAPTLEVPPLAEVPPAPSPSEVITPGGGTPL